jgi:hypothetical protein
MTAAYPYVVTFRVLPDARKRIHVRAYNATDAMYQACVEMAQLEGGDTARCLRVEPDCPAHDAPLAALGKVGEDLGRLLGDVLRQGEKKGDQK